MATIDPAGPQTGSGRVFRGGSWRSDAGCLRSAIRGSGDPGDRYYNVGFRLARSLALGPLDSCQAAPKGGGVLLDEATTEQLLDEIRKRLNWLVKTVWAGGIYKPGDEGGLEVIFEWDPRGNRDMPTIRHAIDDRIRAEARK